MCPHRLHIALQWFPVVSTEAPKAFMKHPQASHHHPMAFMVVPMWLKSTPPACSDAPRQAPTLALLLCSPPSLAWSVELKKNGESLDVFICPASPLQKAEKMNEGSFLEASRSSSCWDLTAGSKWLVGVGGGEEGLAATAVEPLPTYLFSLLSLALLVSYLRLCCQIQTNKDSPQCFLLSFKTLALIYRPLIHFELIFVFGLR